jgi:type IV pilus assembly protein PilY1
MSNIRKGFTTRQTAFFVSLIFGMLFGSSALHADDLEAYLKEPSDPLPPNVLFILDESGSMARDQSGTWVPDTNSNQRTYRLKQAMHDIVDNTDMGNVMAGMMGYTTVWPDGVANTRLVTLSDFLLVEDHRPTMDTAINGLQHLRNTPTVKAIEAGVDWFEGDFTDFNGVTRTSPIGEQPKDNWCRPNHMVILTDGQPNTNNMTTYNSSTGAVACTRDATSRWDSGRCAREIAAWAYNADLKTGGDWDIDKDEGKKQNITTHTIGFDTDDGGSLETFMKSISTAGGGKYYPASSAEELVAAFESIISEASENISYTYNAPAIPFNSDNAAVSGDYIYVPVFAPKAEKFWKGNVKKFAIDIEDGIVTISGTGGGSAISGTGEFQDVNDFWNSGASDGGDPLQGGAASRMEGTRTLYTYTGTSLDLTDSTNIVDVDAVNPDITIAMLDVATIAEKDELIQWITWQDAANEHEGEMGAPLHTNPAVAEYSGGDVVLIPTSEGVLQAIDENTGDELWAFMPQELLKDISTLKNNPDASKPYYGLDGPLTVYDSGSGKYAIFGMRRGGKSYYLLDITSRLAPKFVKKIDKTSLSSRLAQTWSKPILVEMNIGGSEREVLVFGGGYDADQDLVNSRVSDDEGNAIFIVDPASGSLIEEISTGDVSDMTNGIAGDVLPVDVNANGIVDRLYASDVGGRIIRVDIPDEDLIHDAGVSGGVTAGVVADVNGGGTGGYQRFFNTPAVGYFSRGGTQFLAIMIGSGNRTDPFNATVTDRFYMIKDRAVWRPPSSYDTVNGWDLENGGDLYNASTNFFTNTAATALIAGAEGWFIDFASTEKSYSKAVLFDYTILFTTYSQHPTPDTDKCKAQGSSGYAFGYAINMLDAAAVFAGLNGEADVLEPEDRYVTLSIKGIPSSPILLFPDDEDGKMADKVYGRLDLEGSGGGNGPPGPCGDRSLEWCQRFRPISWEEVIPDE